MEEKISLEKVLPVAAEVFCAIPKDEFYLAFSPNMGHAENILERAELFAEFTLAIHKKLNGSE